MREWCLKVRIPVLSSEGVTYMPLDLISEGITHRLHHYVAITASEVAACCVVCVCVVWERRVLPGPL